MININKFKIHHNYVLVLPDQNFTTYSFGGIETDIAVGDTPVYRHKNDDMEKEVVDTNTSYGQHLSVRGQVYKVPERLIYNGDKMWEERKRFSNDKSAMDVIQNLRESSVLFDVPMEVQVGDMVYFDYQQHYDCVQYGRVIETELGDMYLMRYDSLMLSHPKDDPKKVKPLNGRILIEKTKETDGKTESGILVPLVSSNTGKVGKFSYATIVATGALCRGYLEDLTACDDPRPLNEGDCVIYKPSGAHLLEWHFHQTLFGGKEVYALHRKDLLLVMPKVEEYA